MCASGVRLGALVDRGVRQLTYAYDFGDNWRHTVTVEGVGPGEPGVSYPRFVAGERRCPPEDVGGFPGFELFLDAMNDPQHEEHERLREWYGGLFAADDVGQDIAQRRVAAIAKRRRVARED